jgi:pimeloyl-ACP methyl ester carboxylesterase
MWPILCALALDTTTLHRITVAPAETLAVTTMGHGPAVVLIPGMFGSAYGFRQLVPQLVEAGFQAIVVEPLAFGTSGRPRRADYSLHAQARRVAGVLDSLGVQEAVLVGHSIGGAIALRVAWLRPELVRAVVSLEGGPAEAAATPGFRRAMSYAPFIRLGGMGLVRRAVRDNLTHASGDAGWVTDDVIRNYTAGAAADLGATLKAYLRIADAREIEPLGPHLGEVRCPVRLLLGSAPHRSGPNATEVTRLEGGAPDFAIVRVAGAGHFLQEEQPLAVLHAVLDVARLTTAAVR